MTPTEIEKKAQDVAVACLTAIRRSRAGGGGTDRDIREIVALHVEDALSEAILGPADRANG